MTITPTLKNNKLQLSGILLVLCAAGGFSTKAILIKLAYQMQSDMDAISLLAIRMVFSLPVFLLVVICKKQNQGRCPAPIDVIKIFLLGFLGYYLSSFLDFSGLRYISAGLERVILFLYPTLVVLFNAGLKKCRLSCHEIRALTLSYGGMLCVYFGQVSALDNQLLKGSILVFGAALSFALYLVGSAQMIKKIGSMHFTAYSMSFACILTLTHYVIQKGLIVPDFSLPVYSIILLMAALSTILPAFCLNAGIQRIGSSNTAVISSLGPIATLFLAYFILHEPLGWQQLLGTFLVLAGVYGISRP